MSESQYVKVIGKVTNLGSKTEVTFPENVGSNNVYRSKNLNGLYNVGDSVQVAFYVYDDGRRHLVSHTSATLDMSPSEDDSMYAICISRFGSHHERRKTVSEVFSEVSIDITQLNDKMVVPAYMTLGTLVAIGSRDEWHEEFGDDYPDGTLVAPVNKNTADDIVHRFNKSTTTAVEVFAYKVGSVLEVETVEDEPETVEDEPETVEDESEVVETSEPVETLEWVNGHYIQESLRPIFTVAKNVVDAGSHINIMLSGPSGYGKTSAFEAMADYIGSDFVRINCAAIMDQESWFGYHEARGGDTVFIPTEFTNKIREGNCLVLLDEANRIEPWLANSLFPILDYARKTDVHGEIIECGPGVVFALSVNEGSQYAGTFSMDAAFKNRVDIIDYVQAPPQDVEVDILNSVYDQAENDEIIRHISELRDIAQNEMLPVDVSIRSSVKVARLVNSGMTIRQAFQYVVVNSVDSDEAKSLVDYLNVALGTM